MKTKNVIWGLILVLIGVLFILKNLDVIYFSWYGLWKLWPLVLVLIGVAILPVKDAIKIVLTIIILVVAGFILVSYPAGESWFDKWSFNNGREQRDDNEPAAVDQRIFEAYDTTINEADLIFDAAAGNFRIDQPTDELFEFTREGNLGKYNYSLKNLGDKREIRIELNEGQVIKSDFRNKVAVKLNPNPLWNLNVDVGAANIDMDLTAFKIGKLDISGGASSINISVGSLQNESKIKINSGASSIDIKVPKDIACQVNTSMVLSSRDLPGFNKVGNGTYVTPEFSDKTKNIVIDIEAAVSSLSIERY